MEGTVGTAGTVTTGSPSRGGRLKAVGGRKRARRKPRGLEITRFFTRAGEDPFDAVEWELRDAKITDKQGETVFEQKQIEVPKS
ncbi:unnamed protein product, partial [marine sediment metagenome]